MYPHYLLRLSNNLTNGDSMATGELLPALNKQPVWTWDWNLPELVSLTLISKFAYQFQFKMLDKTPKLASLSVNLKSPKRYRRTVELIDLVKPDSNHPLLSTFLAQERARPVHQKKYHSFERFCNGVHMFRARGRKTATSNQCFPKMEHEEAEKDDEVWIEMEYIDITSEWAMVIGGSSSHGIV
ncbi:hypothetical protein FBU30_007801 [Linnemannia zychae]|nr:hypothetical protein FBU30_007801 [Linnemannia zychae]